MLLAAYWLAILIATHVPKDFPAVPSGQWDKLAHFSAYATLAVLFATAWQLSAGVLVGAHLRIAWLLLATYGAFDELTQPLFGRDASGLDWLADATGAAVGLVVFQWLSRRVKTRNQPPEIVCDSPPM
jgi:VanZ family protein